MGHRISESRRTLLVAERLLKKLEDGVEPFEEKDVLELKYAEKLTAMIAKLVPLVKIQEPHYETNKKKTPAVKIAADDKVLLEDFIARKISERLDGDRLNNPE